MFLNKIIAFWLFMGLLSLNQSYAGAFPGNNFLGKKVPNTRFVYTHISIPFACRSLIIDSMTAWNNVGANISMTWGGYADYNSWNQSIGQSTPTSNNTANMSVEMGGVNNINAVAEAPYLFSTSTTTLQNGEKIKNIRDSDIVLNVNKSSNFWCSNSPPPSGKFDIKTALMHEMGHTWGLDHDNVNLPALMQPVLGYFLAPTAKDISRMKYLRP